MEAEMGVMQPELRNGRDYQEPPETRRKAWNKLSLKVSRGNPLC